MPNKSVRSLVNTIAIIGLQIGGVGVSAAAPATPPVSPAIVLTNAAAILDLSAAHAAQALPVRLRGVVVDESQPRERAVILGDQSACVYLFAATNIFAPFHRQDVLEITGVTSPGEFAPCVLAKAAQKLGSGVAPLARPATYQG